MYSYKILCWNFLPYSVVNSLSLLTFDASEPEGSSRSRDKSTFLDSSSNKQSLLDQDPPLGIHRIYKCFCILIWLRTMRRAHEKASSWFCTNVGSQSQQRHTVFCILTDWSSNLDLHLVTQWDSHNMTVVRVPVSLSVKQTHDNLGHQFVVQVKQENRSKATSPVPRTQVHYANHPECLWAHMEGSLKSEPGAVGATPAVCSYFFMLSASSLFVFKP